MNETARAVTPAAPTSPGAGADAELVTLYRASKRTGINCSVLYKWVKRGWLPALEIRPRGKRTVTVVSLDDVRTLAARPRDRSAEQRLTKGPPIEARRARVARQASRGESSTAIAASEGVSDVTIRNDLRALGLTQPPGRRAKYPPAEPRPCGYCGETFTPEWPSHAIDGRGTYCSQECWDYGLFPDEIVDGWSGVARKRRKGRRRLRQVAAEGRRRKHEKAEQRAVEVADEARRLAELRPGISEKDVIDTLIVRFLGTDHVKLPDGQRRPGRDLTYRAARARIRRALVKGFELLGRPAALERFIG